jgi:CheY-like chemotaxis protein
MDEETIARAFERFYTTKPDGKGTGLSQVYSFVKQSGGHVKIYSEIGHGTTVKIYLPRLVSAPVEAEGSRRAHIPQGSSGETILVIEDDEGVRFYSAESLRELGYHVIEAVDGPSALAALEGAGDIHLMFIDVALPAGMTGADIARRAKELRPDMKILFTTGYARNAIIHNGRVDRGVRLLTKPFSFADLAATDALDDV